MGRHSLSAPEFSLNETHDMVWKGGMRDIAMRHLIARVTLLVGLVLNNFGSVCESFVPDKASFVPKSDLGSDCTVCCELVKEGTAGFSWAVDDISTCMSPARTKSVTALRRQVTPAHHKKSASQKSKTHWVCWICRPPWHI